MCNCNSCYKKFVFIIIFILLVGFIFFNFNIDITFAEKDDASTEFENTTKNILDDIDFDLLEDDFKSSNYFESSFKDFVIDALNDNYFNDYNSVFYFIKSLFFNYLNENLRFFIFVFILIVCYELIKSFLPEKFCEYKFLVKIIFSVLISFLSLSVFKNYYNIILDYVSNLFSFAEILFPILISLITLSGANTSSSVFGSISVFLLETGLYILKFILMPLGVSILLFSLFSSIFSKNKFSSIIDLLKQVFKYVIILFFIIFGLISSVGTIASGSKDGINLKLTKFAIKNYVPILGGYVSDGFDFLHSCSVLIKNAVGFCSIVFMIINLLSPLALSLIFVLGFKILSVISSFIGSGDFANNFGDISKSFSNFLTIILGGFLIIFMFVFLVIVSVKVV